MFCQTNIGGSMNFPIQIDLDFGQTFTIHPQHIETLVIEDPYHFHINGLWLDANATDPVDAEMYVTTSKPIPNDADAFEVLRMEYRFCDVFPTSEE